jgi:hypothetical protein
MRRSRAKAQALIDQGFQDPQLDAVADTGLLQRAAGGLGSLFNILDRPRKLVTLGFADMFLDDSLDPRGGRGEVQLGHYFDALLGDNQTLKREIPELVGEHGDISGSQVLHLLGWEATDSMINRVPRFLASLGTEVLTDPLTYATAGASAIGKKALIGSVDKVIGQVTRQAADDLLRQGAYSTGRAAREGTEGIVETTYEKMVRGQVSDEAERIYRDKMDEALALADEAELVDVDFIDPQKMFEEAIDEAATVVKVNESSSAAHLLADKRFASLAREKEHLVDHLGLNAQRTRSGVGRGPAGELAQGEQRVGLGGLRLAVPFSLRYQTKPIRGTVGLVERARTKLTGGKWYDSKTWHRWNSIKKTWLSHINLDTTELAFARGYKPGVQAGWGELRVVQDAMQRVGTEADPQRFVNALAAADGRVSKAVDGAKLGKEEEEEFLNALPNALWSQEVRDNLRNLPWYEGEVAEAAEAFFTTYDESMSELFGIIGRYMNVGKIDDYVPLIPQAAFSKTVRSLGENGLLPDPGDEATVRRLFPEATTDEELKVAERQLNLFNETAMHIMGRQGLNRAEAALGDAPFVHRRFSGKYVTGLDTDAASREMSDIMFVDGHAFGELDDVVEEGAETPRLFIGSYKDQDEMSDSLADTLRRIIELNEDASSNAMQAHIPKKIRGEKVALEDIRGFEEDPIQYMISYTTSVQRAAMEAQFIKSATDFGFVTPGGHSRMLDNELFNIAMRDDPLVGRATEMAQAIVDSADERAAKEASKQSATRKVSLGGGDQIDIPEQVWQDRRVQQELGRLRRHVTKINEQKALHTARLEAEKRKLINKGVSEPTADALVAANVEGLDDVMFELERETQHIIADMDRAVNAGVRAIGEETEEAAAAAALKRQAALETRQSLDVAKDQMNERYAEQVTGYTRGPVTFTVRNADGTVDYEATRDTLLTLAETLRARIGPVANRKLAQIDYMYREMRRRYLDLNGEHAVDVREVDEVWWRMEQLLMARDLIEEQPEIGVIYADDVINGWGTVIYGRRDPTTGQHVQVPLNESGPDLGGEVMAVQVGVPPMRKARTNGDNLVQFEVPGYDRHSKTIIAGDVERAQHVARSEIGLDQGRSPRRFLGMSPYIEEAVSPLEAIRRFATDPTNTGPMHSRAREISDMIDALTPWGRGDLVVTEIKAGPMKGTVDVKFVPDLSADELGDMSLVELAGALRRGEVGEDTVRAAGLNTAIWYNNMKDEVNYTARVAAAGTGNVTKKLNRIQRASATYDELMGLISSGDVKGVRKLISALDNAGKVTESVEYREVKQLLAAGGPENSHRMDRLVELFFVENDPQIKVAKNVLRRNEDAWQEALYEPAIRTKARLDVAIEEAKAAAYETAGADAREQAALAEIFIQEIGKVARLNRLTRSSRGSRSVATDEDLAGALDTALSGFDELAESGHGRLTDDFTFSDLKRVSRQLAHAMGDTTPTATTGMVPIEQFGLAGRIVEGAQVTPEMGLLMQNVFERYHHLNTNRGLEEISDSMSRLYTWWRGAVTAARSAFHVRNFVGGVANGSLIGVGPQHYQAVLGPLKVFKQTYTETGSIEAALATVPKKLEPAFRAAVDTGVLSAGFSRSELRVAQAVRPNLSPNPFDPNFPLIRFGGATMEWMEDGMRMAAFYRHFDPSAPIESAAYARDLTYAAHFDYQHLTNAERRIKKFLPFFVWTRRNLPLQLRALIERPGHAQFWHHLRNASRDNFGAEQQERFPLNMYSSTLAAEVGGLFGGDDSDENGWWTQMLWDPDLPVLALDEIPIFYNQNPDGGFVVPFTGAALDSQAWAAWASNLLGPQLSIPLEWAFDSDTYPVTAPTGLNHVLRWFNNLPVGDLGTTVNSGNVEIADWQRDLMNTAVPFVSQFTAPFEADPTRAGRAGFDVLQPGQRGVALLDRIGAGALANFGVGLGAKNQTPQDTAAQVWDAEQFVAEMRRRAKRQAPLP